MPSFSSRASSTENYPLQSLSQRTSLSSPNTPMVRLDSENAASGSGYLGARRQNSGHGHGKGKKRVSDEGMHEEEGLLSGMSGRMVDDDLDNERSNVSGDMEPSDTPG